MPWLSLSNSCTLARLSDLRQNKSPFPVCKMGTMTFSSQGCLKLSKMCIKGLAQGLRLREALSKSHLVIRKEWHKEICRGTFMEISCLFSYPIHLLFHLYFGHHSLLHMRYNLKVLAVHGKLCQFIFFFNLKMSSYLSLLKGNFVVYTILDLQLLSLRILKILFNYFLAA